MRVEKGVAVVVCVMAAACAARPPVVERPSASVSAEIDVLVTRGCYACLASAFEKAVDARLPEAAFQTALLLAARAKELGLPHDPWLDAARQRIPPGDGWQRYLDIVQSLPLDPFSGDREELLLEGARFRRPREVLAAWRTSLEAGPGSDVFRAYLDVSLACGPFFYDARESSAEAVLQRFPDVPLLKFRVGICSRPLLLNDIRDPDFVDAELDLGRAALARERAHPDDALQHFEAARRAFPDSATIATAAATLYQQQEEWARALDAYDAVLRLVPTHRDALLGRTVSLSQLQRHDDAITAATSLIDLGGWFVAEAYYWRAWNRYQAGSIAEARADIDRSKAAAPSTETLVLSGIIAWRENRLPVADLEFSAALQQDFGHCEAAQYLGNVRAGARRWEEGLAALTHAERCLALAIDANRKAIAELSATEDDGRTNARRIASHQRSIVDAERRRATVIEQTASVRRQSNIAP